MAGRVLCLARQLLSKFSSVSSLQNLSALRPTSHLRCYSQYATTFQNPILPRDNKEAVLEAEAFKEVQHLPVRAALNYYTNSMFLDPLVAQFIRHVMNDGKKDLARQVVGHAFVRVKRIQVQKYHEATPEDRDTIILDPLIIFHKAIENARPYLCTHRIRRGATWYQVPRPITEKSAISTAMKWFVAVCNDKPKGTRFHNVLAKELIGASEYTGRVIQKKIELHKLCEANKTYAHFRWG